MNRRDFGRLSAAAALASAWPGAAQQGVEDRKKVRFSVMLWALEKQAPFDALHGVSGRSRIPGDGTGGRVSKSGLLRASRNDHAQHAQAGPRLRRDERREGGFAVPADRSPSAPVLEHLQAATDLECPQVILLSANVCGALEDAIQFKTSIENLTWLHESRRGEDRHRDRAHRSARESNHLSGQRDRRLSRSFGRSTATT